MVRTKANEQQRSRTALALCGRAGDMLQSTRGNGSTAANGSGSGYSGAEDGNRAYGSLGKRKLMHVEDARHAAAQRSEPVEATPAKRRDNYAGNVRGPFTNLPAGRPVGRTHHSAESERKGVATSSGRHDGPKLQAPSDVLESSSTRLPRSTEKASDKHAASNKRKSADDWLGPFTELLPHARTMEHTTSPEQLHKGPPASRGARDRNVAVAPSRDTSTKHLPTTTDSAAGRRGAMSNDRSRRGDDRLGRSTSKAMR
mmetsp:Transcript_6089/g.22337  ORF Transcript_6089/g.22337 Transcript_6089/m.22337 type:complete len:257 (+) Transcript_6089:251-1021(+)